MNEWCDQPNGIIVFRTDRTEEAVNVTIDFPLFTLLFLIK